MRLRLSFFRANSPQKGIPMSKNENVDTAHLNADIAEMATKAQAVTEKNGDLRNLIQQKLETRGYEKTALGMLRRISKLSDDKLADFRRTFDGGYQEVVGAREGQPELSLGDEASTTELDADTVVPFDEAAE